MLVSSYKSKFGAKKKASFEIQTPLKVYSNRVKYFTRAIYFHVHLPQCLMMNTELCGTGSPRSQNPSRSPRSRRRAKTLSLNLRPPIIIEKGPRGYGFTLQAIRVNFDDTNYYKVHHLVSVSSRTTCLFAFLLNDMLACTLFCLPWTFLKIVNF